MKKLHLIVFALMILGGTHVCSAQNPPAITSQQQVQALAQQTGWRLQAQNTGFSLIRQRADNDGKTGYVSQSFDSEEYQVWVRVFVCADEETAIRDFRQAENDGGGFVGVDVSDFGNQAKFWGPGRLHVRKGNALIFVRVDSKEQLRKTVDENARRASSSQPRTQADGDPHIEQAGGAGGIVLLETDPLRPQRELAEKFAKETLAVLESAQ